MDSSSAPIYAWSYGIAACGYAVFSVYLYFHGRSWNGGVRAWTLLAAAITTAIWSASGFIFAVSGKFQFLTANLLIDVFRYGVWYLFLLTLLTVKRTPTATGSWSSFAGFAIALIALGLLVHGATLLGLTTLGSLSRILLFQSLAMILLGLMLVEQLFRSVSVDSRWNVKPLCLGLAGAFLYDLYLFSDALLFNRLDADVLSIRGFVQALIIPLLALSTERSRDWVAKLRLSQKAAFHSATLLIAGAYLLFMAGVGYYVRYFGGDWGRALQLALLFAASLMLGLVIFSRSMRAKLRVQVGKHFFSYRYDYREEWLRFTQTLSVQDSPTAMGEQVIRGLADMLESPAGALWLKHGTQRSLAQAARWNMPTVLVTEDMGSPLCQFLTESGWVINLEEFRAYPGRYGKLQIPEWLSAIPNAWLIVPLMVGKELIGFIVLASSRTTVDVNWEINDLLRTAGRQAASFLAQMLATEALLEVRKFDAFNRMSAFVVHDLKNIVTQLSLMLKNAERHRANPEFQQDMLMTVEHSVERMRQLMLQLREGATPPGTAVGVDLAEVITRIQTAKAALGRKVEVQFVEKLATRGHTERIERVIGHLVQNALDACSSEGRVWVRLERFGGQALVEVGDTGHGMPADFIRERLFRPFQTTKKAGMGIGAYESSQYIQELGGKMEVESEVDVGTRIRIFLPLLHLDPESEPKREAA